MEFGRPTFLVVRPDDDPVVVTPLMESKMVGSYPRAATPVSAAGPFSAFALLDEGY